ncbi:MAG: (2Fe-2S)-binding protein [Thiotrichales bacterium]|nr:(2Fe-2S)-binding protein [Thiotrichales bacterium]
MYVCVCNAVTEKDIHTAALRGVQTLDGLNNELDVGKCCGCCCETAEECLNQALTGKPLSGRG